MFTPSAVRRQCPVDRPAVQPSPIIARFGPVLAVLGASVLFGTTGTSQALGPIGTTALGVGAVRLAIGAVALIAVALARRPPGSRDWRRHLPALLLGGIAVAGYQLGWFAGLRRTGVALGTVVGIGSGPVFAGLIQLARRRSGLSRPWIIGTGLTIAGAAMLVARGPGSVSADVVGLSWMLGAGLSYAVYAQVAKDAIEKGLDSAVAMAAIFTIGAVLMAPLLALEPLGWLACSRGLLLALHLGLFTTGLAYWLYGWGLRHLPVPTVVTLTLAEPLTASLLGVMVLGERLGPFGWFGAVVVLTGLVVAARGDRSRS